MSGTADEVWRSAASTGEVEVGDFRRYGSARKLYHFHVDNALVTGRLIKL